MKKNLLLLLGAASLTAAPLFMTNTSMNGGAEFAGADDQAKQMIADSHADYQPWFKPLWDPPSTEIQCFLFSVQAAIGAGALGYSLGYYKARRQSSGERKT
jgi:cobalt/nickel transport protein